MSTTASQITARLEVPAIAVGAATAVIAAADGNALEMPLAEAAKRISTTALPLLCHAPMVGRRLGVATLPALDVLELFAFVHPARFCVPTVGGLASALSLSGTTGLADEAHALYDIAGAIIEELLMLSRIEQEGEKAEIVRAPASLRNVL